MNLSQTKRHCPECGFWQEWWRSDGGRHSASCKRGKRDASFPRPTEQESVEPTRAPLHLPTEGRC
jgi:hypothetical protein